MNTRYFDENGKELVLGVTLVTPTDAAYITKDPNDPIFRQPPSDKAIKIVDGKVTYVDRRVSFQELERINIEERERALVAGYSVKGNYLIRGAPVNGHIAVLRIGQRITTDVIGLTMIFSGGYTDTVPLQVAKNTAVMVSSITDATKLLEGGFMVKAAAYEMERQGLELIRQSSNSVQTLKALRGFWAENRPNVLVDLTV